MSILWTIIIGFIAGVIAKFIMPVITNRPVLSSRPFSGSWVLSLRVTSGKLWAGIVPMRAQG